MLRRINGSDIMRNGNEGIGSRRRSRWVTRVLVAADDRGASAGYKVVDDEVRIAQCRLHYV